VCELMPSAITKSCCCKACYYSATILNSTGCSNSDRTM